MSRAFLISVALLTLASQTVRRDVIITATETGDDVVLVGSGTLNIAALTPPPGTGGAVGSQISPGVATLIIGNPAQDVDEYQLISGPTAFGTGLLGIPATTTSGDKFGVLGNVGSLLVPDGFTGGSVSAIATWANSSFASLNMTPGTYQWTWGSGPDADSLTFQVIPEPSSFFLCGGVLCLFLIARNRPPKSLEVC